MSEEKFTPGPWMFESRGWRVVGDTKTICEPTMHLKEDLGITDESRANAHLIETAPDMYKFIEDAPCPNSDCRSGIVQAPGDTWSTVCGFCHERDEILSKARGETV